MNDKQIIEQIVAALEIGVDLARGNAEAVHASYRGYYPERHAEVDRDVSDMEAALAAARAHLEQPTEPAPSTTGDRAEVDRSDAVNLARNVVFADVPVTPTGIQILADAVLRMDAAILAAARSQPVLEPLPLMSEAFRTTVAHGPSEDYRMVFKFKDLDSLHAADGEWRKFRSAP